MFTSGLLEKEDNSQEEGLKRLLSWVKQNRTVDLLLLGLLVFLGHRGWYRSGLSGSLRRSHGYAVW